jgi:hypothetical protein
VSVPRRALSVINLDCNVPHDFVALSAHNAHERERSGERSPLILPFERNNSFLPPLFPLFPSPIVHSCTILRLSLFPSLPSNSLSKARLLFFLPDLTTCLVVIPLPFSASLDHQLLTPL